MLKCSKCGAINADDAKFCEKCGESLAGQAPDTEETQWQASQWDRGEETDQGWQQWQADQGWQQWQTDQGWQQGQTDQGWQQDQADQEWQQWQMNQGPADGQDNNAWMNKRGSFFAGLSKLQKVVIAEAVCLTVLVIVFFMVGNSRNSPQAVAEKYFKVYADQDWKSAYGMLEIPDGEFIQEGQYEKIMEAEDHPEITNFQVQASASAGDGITRSFQVVYSVKGQGQSSATVNVVKQTGKNMLFFDNWKVSADGLIAQNYSIYVPEGAQAAVDGIQLSEDQISGDNGEGMDCYQISVFDGTHTIQVEAPWFETYENQFDTESQPEGYTVSGLKMTEEGEQAVEVKIQDALQTYYQEALAGSSFDAVEDLFADGAPDSNEEAYDQLKEDLKADSNSVLKQIQFSGFQCDVYDGDYYNGGLQAEMRYDYNVSYTYTYSYSGRTEDRTDDGSSYADAQLVYDGDTYKLWSFDPGYVSY